MTSVDAVLDPAGRAVIPPTVLTGVLDVGRREGSSVIPWFSGTGLEPGLLQAPGVLVSLHQVRTVLRRALPALDRGPLGIEIGERDALLSFGLLGVAMRASGTLGDALALAEELHQTAGSLLDMELEDLGEHTAIRFRERWPDPDLVAFLCEEALTSTLVMIRSMLGEPSWAPSRVALTYPPPVHAAHYRRTFRCPVGFRSATNSLVLPSALLRRRLATAHEPTRRAALEACRTMSAQGEPPSDLVASIEMMMAGHLRRPLSMRDVAERLHVTERTLHRRLSESGVRFRDIANRVRERRATLLLARSSVPISAVAAEVGFSDAREFRRAYLRWTGRTPSRARQDGGAAAGPVRTAG